MSPCAGSESQLRGVTKLRRTARRDRPEYHCHCAGDGLSPTARGVAPHRPHEGRYSGSTNGAYTRRGWVRFRLIVPGTGVRLSSNSASIAYVCEKYNPPLGDSSNRPQSHCRSDRRTAPGRCFRHQGMFLAQRRRVPYLEISASLRLCARQLLYAPTSHNFSWL
jgi:hypothetical protein